ncbi:MAG: ferritin family protein [Candidatus Omnitrophota bacterium]
MNKKELIRLLREALLGEEKAVPIYTKHLDSALFWTGLGKEKSEEIQRIFSQLAKDSKKHKEVVENIIKRLEE